MNKKSLCTAAAASTMVAALIWGTSAAAEERIERRTLEASANRGVYELSEPSTEQDVLRQVEIETGKSMTIKTSYSIKRVSVGDPEILDVVVLSPTELQLVAKNLGTTNMLIWDRKGRPQAAIDIHVGAPHSRLESELRRILGSDNIRVLSAGNGIVLKGSVRSAIEMEQALVIARAVLSEGDDAQAKNRNKEAKQVINLLEVRGQQQVMLEVVISEMSRTVRKEFGTNFNALIESGGSNYQIFGFLQNMTSLSSDAGNVIEVSDMINLIGTATGLGALTQVQVFLDVLGEQGLSRILAEPTLVARSGETANFLVGGEVPIPIHQGGKDGSISIMFKEFGVGVAFTPTVLANDRIHLEVRPEVSEPDFSFGTEVGGFVVPGFKTRRVSTSIELADGQSFAIAGLLRDDLVELVSQYPLLGKIPILGALFRSSQYLKEQTELVMIVTPRLVKPLKKSDIALPTDHFIEPSSFEFYMLGMIEGRAPKPDDTSELPENEKLSAGMIGGMGHNMRAEPTGSDVFEEPE